MEWKHFSIAAGGNSGFQAINYAARCGVSRIILTGYDLGVGSDGLTHWHGDHPRGLSNPQDAFLKRCALTLDAQARAIANNGVQVLNASRETRLRLFERVTMDEALSQVK